MLFIYYHHFPDCYLWQKVICWEQPEVCLPCWKAKGLDLNDNFCFFQISCWHISELAIIGPRPLLFFCGTIVTFLSLSQHCLILDPPGPARHEDDRENIRRVSTNEETEGFTWLNGYAVLCRMLGESWTCMHLELSAFHYPVPWWFGLYMELLPQCPVCCCCLYFWTLHPCIVLYP